MANLRKKKYTSKKALPTVQCPKLTFYF